MLAAYALVPRWPTPTTCLLPAESSQARARGAVKGAHTGGEGSNLG